MTKKVISLLLVLAVLFSMIGAAFVTEASAVTIDPNKMMLADWVFGDTLYERGPAELMKEYSELGITDVFLLVKGTGGKLAWQSKISGTTMVYTSTDLVKQACDAAKPYGIRVHAWIAAAQDTLYAQRNQNAVAYHFRAGTALDDVTVNMDMRNAEYRAYVRSLIKELNSYDIAGVHFDYIRYSTLFYDWCASMRNDLINNYGITKAEYNAAVKAMCMTANEDYGGNYKYTTNADGYYIYSASGTAPSGANFAEALLGQGTTDANNGAKKIAQMRKDVVKNFIAEVTKDLSSDKLISCAIMPESVYDVFGSAAYCQDPAVLKDVIDFAAIMSYSSEYGYASDDEWVARLAAMCADDGLDAVAAIQTFDSEVGNSNPTCANIYNQYYNILKKQKSYNATSTGGKILGTAFFRGAKMTLASAYVKNSNTMNIKVHQQDEVGNGITKIVLEAKNGVTITKVSNKSGWASGTSFTISSDKKSLTIANSSVDLKSYGSGSFDITYSGTVSETTGAFYMRSYNHNGTMDYGFCNTLFPAHEHSYTGKVTTAATCTANGVKTYTCSCGDKYTESIPAIGHSYDNGVITTIPSCVAEGIKTFTCANCGDAYTENIASGGHNYQVGTVIQQATCQQNGKITYVCSGCNDSYTTLTTKAAHNYESIYDDETESIIDVCTVCGDVSDVTCAERHAQVETWTVGNKTHAVFCYNCNAYYETMDCVFEVIERSEPTCTKDGYELYVCNGHYDLNSMILTKDFTTNAGCENNYTVTLPAACTYVYTSNMDGTHTGKCTACGQTSGKESCHFENGVCTGCGYRPQNFINLHFDSNSIANTPSAWTLNKDVSFSINTATSSMSGTATGADPYIGMPATGSILNYTVQETDIVEIRMKSSITSGSAEDIQLFYSTTDTKAYSDANSVFFAPKKGLNSGAYEVYQASFDPSVIGKTINALRIDPYDLASNSLTASFEIDYIYVGPAAHAPSKQAKMLYFGFTNNAEAVARYSNSVYEGYNFDLVPWGVNSSNNNAAFSYADEGNLVISGITGTFAYAQTTTPGGNLTQAPLEYTVGNNDVVVIRYKTENITASADSVVRLYYGVNNTIGQISNSSYISLPGNVSSANNNYVVVSARISQLSGTLLSSIRPYFNGIADDGTGKGKISIDYIYVGPAANSPADMADALYFDFGNTSADQLRYDAHTYGYYNYDTGGWHATSSRNSLPVYNNDAGTMTTIVVGENPYLQITGAQAMFSSHPLNFDPSAAEMAEIRLKLDNLALINEGIPARVILKFMLDDDDTTTGSLYFTRELDISDLDSSEYVTVTFPVNDFFQDVEKVTTVYTAVQGVKPAGDNVATISYDYLYVGPRNKDAYFVYFTDEGGSNIISYAVSDAENPVTYPGQTPMKEGNNWIHYNFVGWADARGNIVDLSTEVFYDDTFLRIVFMEAAHEYEFTYTGTIHSGVCSCGAPYVEENHAWDNGTITKPATCTTDGIRTFTCFCGASYTETIKATGHKHITSTLAPTCTERGYVLHVCSCGDNFKTDYVDALGHKFIYTSNEDDTHTITCDNGCKYNVTESHDWNEGEVLSNQTCTTDGSTLFTCGTCYDEKVETYKATGHKGICVEAKPATCTEPGNNKYYKCENCGNCYLDEDCIYLAPGEAYFQIAATGHKYVEKTVAATCTTGGYIEHTCLLCNDSYKTAETPALGHSHGTPADNGNGTHTAICACGNAKTDDHSFVNGSCICGAKEATGPIVDENIYFGEQLALENDLTMTFRLNPALIAAYDINTLYIEVERDIYGSDGSMEVERRILDTYVDDGRRLVFSLTGIAAAQMNDEIRATLHIKDAKGQEYVSPVLKTSITIYLRDTLNSMPTGYDKLYTLIMDMLNYGTAAQNYFGRHTDAPANEAYEIFKAYESYATTALKEDLVDMYGQIPVAGATAAVSQTLDLGTRIGITYKVLLPAGVNAANAKLVIKDAEGNELETIDVSTGTTDSRGRYIVNFYGSSSRDMRRVVYATVYVNGVAISNTYTYSISTYAYETATDVNAPESVLALTNAMVIYGDSAVAYFG